MAQCIAALVNAFNSAVLRCDFQVASCVLKALVECGNANCVSAQSLHALLSQIVQKSLEAGFKNGEFGLCLVLSCLINLSPALALRNSEFSELIHSAIEGASQFVTSSEYIARRDLVSPAAGNLDRLETLVVCLQCLRSADWETQVLLRPYLMDGIADQLTGVSVDNQHVLPAIDASKCVGKRHIPAVFLQTELAAEVSELSLSERWILEDIMSSTIDAFSKSVGECAKALLRIPFVHPQFEQVLVDVVLSRSLESPTSLTDVPRTFFVSCLHRASVLQETLKPCIEAGIKSLCNRQITVEAEWLLANSLNFLINNNMKLPMEGGRVFEKFLAHAVRVQFTNSLLSRLPEPLHSQVPADPGFGTPLVSSDEYQKIKEVVRIKEGSELEVLGVLKSMDHEDRYKFFVHALIENGARTLTHLSRLLDLYGSILTNAATHGFVSSKRHAQDLLAETLFQFWTNNDFRLEKSVEIFLRNGMIAPSDVAKRLPVDETRLVSLNLIRTLVDFLIERKSILATELEERIGTDMYEAVSHELSTVNSDLHSVLHSILVQTEGAPEMKKWVVKHYAQHIDVEDDLVVLLKV